MRSSIVRFLNRYPTDAQIPAERRDAGVTLDHVTRAAQTVDAANSPLRESIVMNEAQAIAELESGPAFALWQETLAVLQRRLYESAYRMWIEPIQVVGFDNGELILDAHPAIRTWVERRYIEVVIEALPEREDLDGVRFR